MEPEWREKFSLPVKSDAATLEILVDDYDMASGNDLMGKFTIPLADAKDRQEHRAWHPLAGEDGVVGADIGHVLLAFKWIHNPNRLSPMDLPPDYNVPPFPDMGFIDDCEKSPNEVQLFLVKGWGLKVMDKNMFSKGGSSDPMVTFLMGDEKQKSKVIKKNLNPEWNTSFTFPVKSDQAIVKAIVDDYDMASGNDEMGRFEIPMNTLTGRQEYRAWYPLTGEDGVQGADIGGVLVGAKWVHNPERVSPVDAPIDWEDPPMEVVHAENEHGFPVNQLGVTLVRAYGLKVMDKNMFSKGGSSDPLVTFELKETGGKAKKSTVKKKDLNPIYKEHFSWQIEEERLFSDTLVVTVDDYDMASGNDFIGKFEIPLNDLNDGVERREWYSLGGEDLVVNADIGSVLLAVRFVHNPDFAPEIESEEEPESEVIELTPLQKRIQKCMENMGGESLNLSKLQLQDIPEEVNALTGLKAINLRGNNMGAIRSDLFTFLPQLTVINLSLNAFSYCPDNIGQLSMLTRIVLSDNQLSSLPIDLFAMPKLTELYAERNYIRELPKGISVALNMIKLMLAGNQLTYISDEVGEMPSLQMFDVRNNPINESEMTVGVRKIYDSTVLHVSKSNRRGLVSRALTVRKLVEENRERQLRLFAEQEKAARRAEKEKQNKSPKSKR